MTRHARARIDRNRHALTVTIERLLRHAFAEIQIHQVSRLVNKELTSAFRQLRSGTLTAHLRRIEIARDMSLALQLLPSWCAAANGAMGQLQK